MKKKTSNKYSNTTFFSIGNSKDISDHQFKHFQTNTTYKKVERNESFKKKTPVKQIQIPSGNNNLFRNIYIIIKIWYRNLFRYGRRKELQEWYK